MISSFSTPAIDCHFLPSFIQIAVYDDRVEVSSPGSLFGGITIEEMKTGSSSIRNKVLADVLAKMNIIEHWGSGILKVFSLCREKGLKEPTIEEKTESLLFSLWRKATQKAAQKLSSVEMQILELVQENAELSRGEIAERLGNMTPDGVKYHLSNLQKKGALKRVGGRKFGAWIVLENKK